MATKSKRTIKKKEKIVEPVIENVEIEKKSINKRCIKRPAISSKSVNIVEEPIPVIEPVNSEPTKRKRTLKLGLETSKASMPKEVKTPILESSIIEEKIVEVNQAPLDTPQEIIAINQNSAFFNEPSIFAKFNINITETEKPYDIISGEINTSFVTSSKEEAKIEEKEADFNTIIYTEITSLEEVSEQPVNEIEETTQEVTEANISDELSKQALGELDLEDISLEDLISEDENSEEDSLNNIDVNAFNLAELDLDDIDLDNLELENLDSEELISEDSQEEQNEIEINFEDLLDSDLIGEASNDIVAEDNLEYSQKNNIINITDLLEQNSSNDSNTSKNFEEQQVEEKIAADSIAIGKFFDSSVPHLDSDKIEFSPIKTPSTSPIFKNFSFEDVESNEAQPEIANNNDGIKIINPNKNSIDSIQNTLENFTPNMDLENLKNTAAPATLTIPVIDADTIYQTMQTDLSDSDGITDYSNIVTPLSDNSYIENEIDEDFSVEDYFGISDTDEETIKSDSDVIIENKNEEISNLTKLLEKYSETISDLSERISSLENNSNEEKTSELESQLDINVEDLGIEDLALISENLNVDELDIEDLDISPEDLTIDDSDIEDLDISPEDLTIDETDLENLDISLEDLPIEDINLENSEQVSELNLDDIEINPEDLDLEDIDLDYIDDLEVTNQEGLENVENILSEALSSKDDTLKDELLSEVLSFEENAGDSEESLFEEILTNKLNENQNLAKDSISDFSKIIESLSKAITELEQAPDIKEEIETSNEEETIENQLSEIESKKVVAAPVTNDKAINILINKNDVFSISVQNETYEIVADFDGISVLSENIRLSTPKNNFFVTAGNKYIEIFNKKTHFVLNTNFEDIEFTNAINNITFAKKNNKIELIIKEAFKFSSVNNKIELSMLNTAIANLANNKTSSNQDVDEGSVCDNKTLLISEETQKVYLPYTIEEVMKKLKTSTEYQTVREIIDNEYTVPLATFKMPIISRFKEAYRFMRTKEKSSVYAAMDLALELMFNSNLNPAVIRAAKDLKELNIYLDCLYENEIEKFDCFKIVYKVLPKIK